MAYDADPAETARKDLEKKVLQMIEDGRIKRSERASLINETYRLAKPHRRKVGAHPAKNPVLTEDDLADIVDATLPETIHDYASDMIAQFTPESEPWTRFGVKESVPAEFAKDVEQMASMVESVVFEKIEESSYFDAAPQCFQDLANGTMAARGRLPERGGDPYEIEAIDPCDLIICQSPARGLVDTKFTEAVIRVSDFKSIYGRYGIKLPTTAARKKDEEEITVADGFYRCWENMRGDRAWRRCVIVDGKLVWEKFYNDDPDVDIIVARWEVDGQSPWGVGPAFRAQPAQRGLNELMALMMVAAGKHVDTPGFYTDDGVANLDQGFEAGDMIATSPDFDVKWWEPGGQLDISFFTESDMRQMVRHALFQDKPEQKGKTPPTAEQWQSLEVRSRQRWEIPRGKIVREWVLPWVLWFKGGLEREGRLGPYKVDNRLFKIVPNSPFAKARQQEEVVRANDILRTMAGYSPDTFAIDFDVAATALNIKHALNDKLVVVRSPEERAALVAGMAQQQQGGAGGEG
jgi:hypothetical protein